MEKTLESIFIKQYEDLQTELQLARKQIEELQTKTVENKQINLEQPVVFKTFSKEVCRLEVSSYYQIEQSSTFKEMTSEQVKSIYENDELLKKYAEMENDYYSSKEKFVKLRTSVFPYTSRIQGKIILLNIYKNYNGSYDCDCYVMNNKDKLTSSKYFDINEKNRLYQYGLEKFKKELEQVYKNKLKKEQKDES